MTTRVKLGTSVIVLPQRNPIIVAKEFATLDALSNGRVILGVAAGWNEHEFKFLGTNLAERGRRLEEGIAVMRELWMQAHPSFDGRYSQFRDALFSPKPAQTSGIPIWLGGNSEAAMKRAARLGDGWHVTGLTPENLGHGIDIIRPRLNGRPFTFSLRIEVDAGGQMPSEFAGPDGSLRQRLPAGIDAAIQVIEAYREIGVEYVIVVPVGASSEKMFEHLKMMGGELLPHFR
jgi:probable F420-dependent oxidoreductase